MIKRKLRAAAALLGTLILLLAGPGYWLVHPELTEMQLFLKHWYYFLLGLALVVPWYWHHEG